VKLLMLDVTVRKEISLTPPWMPIHRTVVREDPISTREKGKWENSAFWFTFVNNSKIFYFLLAF
jgi:hypothetical protein